MSLYPELPSAAAKPQEFRLHKINEIEDFLHKEIETRNHLHKKYRRAVNALDGACATLGAACIATGAVGAGLLASGIGAVAGLVLEGITAGAGVLDLIGIAISRRCSVEAAKHEAIHVLAASKLNTIHSHVSKALEDGSISDDEYKLVLEEVDKYRAMKDEIRHKFLAGAATTSATAIHEEEKQELLKQAHTALAKKLATALESTSL
jgi:hypothetical protein